MYRVRKMQRNIGCDEWRGKSQSRRETSGNSETAEGNYTHVEKVQVRHFSTTSNYISSTFPFWGHFSVCAWLIRTAVVQTEELKVDQCSARNREMKFKSFGNKTRTSFLKRFSSIWLPIRFIWRVNLQGRLRGRNLRAKTINMKVL